MEKIFNVDKKLLKNYIIHWLKYFISSLIPSLFWYYYVMQLRFNNIISILNMFVFIIFAGIAVFSAVNVIKGFIGTITNINTDLEKISLDVKNKYIKIYKKRDMAHYVYEYEILELQEIKLNLGYIKLIGNFKYNYEVTSDYHLPYKYENNHTKKISIMRLLKDEEVLINMLNELKH